MIIVILTFVGISLFKEVTNPSEIKTNPYETVELKAKMQYPESYKIEGLSNAYHKSAGTYWYELKIYSDNRNFIVTAECLIYSDVKICRFFDTQQGVHQ